MFLYKFHRRSHNKVLDVDLDLAELQRLADYFANIIGEKVIVKWSDMKGACRGENRAHIHTQNPWRGLICVNKEWLLKKTEKFWADDWSGLIAHEVSHLGNGKVRYLNHGSEQDAVIDKFIKQRNTEVVKVEKLNEIVFEKPYRYCYKCSEKIFEPLLDIKADETYGSLWSGCFDCFKKLLLEIKDASKLIEERDLLRRYYDATMRFFKTSSSEDVNNNFSSENIYSTIRSVRDFDKKEKK